MDDKNKQKLNDAISALIETVILVAVVIILSWIASLCV